MNDCTHGTKYMRTLCTRRRRGVIKMFRRSKPAVWRSERHKPVPNFGESTPAHSMKPTREHRQRRVEPIFFILARERESSAETACTPGSNSAWARISASSWAERGGDDGEEEEEEEEEEDASDCAVTFDGAPDSRSPSSSFAAPPSL